MTDRTAPSSDARKRHHERDMADAHATARARDARVEESFEERAERYGLDWDVVAHLMSEQPTRRAYRTRTQAIDPETGTFTPLTQEPDMTDQPEPYDFHDEAHRALLNDDLSKGWQAGLHALLAIHDTLAEIRDRLPERTEVKVAPFNPDVIARNLDAIKHELETPMRGHGECCEPAPTDDLPGEPVEVEPEKTHPCPGCGTFTGERVCNSCWGTSDDPEAGYSQAECIEDVPAPADDGLAEWERELFRPAICCGKCPPIVGGGYDCTCEGNPKCRCGSVRFGYPDHICTKPPRHEGPHGYAGVFWSEPGPADDLPGEPVEPGDLRAGDRVAFMWGDERITGTLVSVHGVLRSNAPASSGYTPNVVWDGEWHGGISDVRLIERAPREDEDRDEALARHSDDANCEWAQYRKDYGVDPTVATHKAFHAGFKAAREHIEAEEAENHPVGCGQMIRDVRDGDGFVTGRDLAFGSPTFSAFIFGAGPAK